MSQVSDELIKKILDEEVEEIILTVNYTILVAATLEEPAQLRYTIPSEYDGVVVSIACSADDTMFFFLDIADKQIYENGLNMAALSHILEAAGLDHEGVDGEVFLGVKAKEKQVVQGGLRSSAGTPISNVRLRIRLFKKE